MKAKLTIGKKVVKSKVFFNITVKYRFGDFILTIDQWNGAIVRGLEDVILLRHRLD